MSTKSNISWTSILKDRMFELRKEKDLSQSQVFNDLKKLYESDPFPFDKKRLDKAFGSLQNYTNYETGAYEPCLDYLKLLSEYYGVSTDYLLGLTDVRSSDTSIKSICENTILSEELAEYISLGNVYEETKETTSPDPFLEAIGEGDRHTDSLVERKIQRRRNVIKFLFSNHYSSYFLNMIESSLSWVKSFNQLPDITREQIIDSYKTGREIYFDDKDIDFDSEKMSQRGIFISSYLSIARSAFQQAQDLLTKMFEESFSPEHPKGTTTKSGFVIGFEESEDQLL